MYYEIFSSPVGPLLLQGADSKLRQLSFLKNRTTKPFVDPAWIRRADYFQDIKDQLVEYFDGRRRKFHVELDFGVPETTFSARVWRELQQIPYGETRSYRDVALNIGRAKAFRAVGQANHRNPIAIIVPCHRVIGSDGTLTGFGGGLDTKKYLLDLESRTSQAKMVSGRSDRVEHFVSP
ncbi:MAG: methylated-DNA--[protein]-cysteine S-methyltransferase [Gammaproteobacteria bacterium]|nr:methylated-DNA--[protein]-cysteine S-methyltransferase [Gammaproteobacteria bacterium]MYF02077.1 methylated-DNA--[protein]-cysteine S-methyltransferase [Gammaproteobacteria bacterium]